MAGILDWLGVGGSPDPSQGGILAGAGATAQPQASNPWGLIGATLKDVGANLASRPEDANNLAQYQQLMARRQLVGAINSTDPATRAQAYQSALAMGIDPTPFRQAAASAAMPKLLSAMQPQQQIAPVTVTPQVSAQDPLNDPSRAAAAQAGISAPSLADALQTVNSPELSAEYAPKLIDQQMAANAPYTLDAGASRFVNNQKVATAPLKPDPNSPFNPDGTPNTAYQQYAAQVAKASQAPAWANVGIASQHLALDQQKQNQSLIDPDTRSLMASQYLAGDKSVLTGLTRGNAANIPLVRAEITRQAKAQGMNGNQIATKMAEFSGLTAGERALGTRTAQVGMASNEFAPMADQAQTAMTALGPSGFMPLAKLEQAYQQNTNDPKLATAHAAVNAVINTYARVINPNGVPTDSDKQHARDMLSTAQSLPAFTAALNQMRSEGAIAKQAPSAARSELGGLFNGNAPRPGLPQPSPALPQKAAPAPAAVKVINGTQYHLVNGQWYQ